MSRSDEDRHEFERLTAMGRRVPEPPCPRVDAVARAMEPSLWSDHVDDHIAYATRHGLMRSQDNFGAIFERRRSILRIRAMDALRALGREEAGLPALATFDPHGMSSSLKKLSFEKHRREQTLHGNMRVQVHHEPAGEVFFLKMVSGIPAPEPEMERDGTVSLAWREGERSAVVHFGTDRSCTLSISSPEGSIETPLDLHSWSDRRAARIVTEAADWVHHDGPFPTTHTEAERPS